VGAKLGAAPVGRAALRVTVGGAIAMAVTAGIGRLLGVSAGESPVRDGIVNLRVPPELSKLFANRGIELVLE